MEEVPVQNDPQNRCALCRAFTLLLIAGGNVYEHYQTLSALQNSALNGCDFCKLLWHCLTRATNEAAIAAATKMENQQILIRGNEINMRITPALNNFSAFDELWVQVGEEEGQGTYDRIDLFTSRRKHCQVCRILDDVEING
jgi:hypothetical protein